MSVCPVQPYKRHHDQVLLHAHTLQPVSIWVGWYYIRGGWGGTTSGEGGVVLHQGREGRYYIRGGWGGTTSGEGGVVLHQGREGRLSEFYTLMNPNPNQSYPAYFMMHCLLCDVMTFPFSPAVLQGHPLSTEIHVIEIHVIEIWRKVEMI